MTNHPHREYGLGDSTPFVQGPPEVVSESGLTPCPVCGCKRLYELRVRVRHPLLAGLGFGWGRYVGCPACPFAGPMLMVADLPGPGMTDAGAEEPSGDDNGHGEEGA